MSGRSIVDAAFAAARKDQRTAFVPYFVGGFPSMLRFRELLWQAQASGATCIELGLPFSDPVADGPILQRAMVDALGKGVTVPKVLQAVAELRKEGFGTPILAMTYANLLVSGGLAKTAKLWAASGLDGVLVPDVPWEEAPPVRAALAKNGLATVAFASPGTRSRRLRSIVQGPDSFVYLVAVYGTTGARKGVAPETKTLLRQAHTVRGPRRTPLCVGFGVSTPDQVRQLAEAGAEGVIVGSALAQALLRGSDPAPLLKALGRACSTSPPARF